MARSFSTGSNAVQLRHYNERVVIDIIRRLGQASKADVARLANLTPPAVATIVGALEGRGYIAECGRRIQGKGPPSVLFQLAPDAAYTFGVHVGRRSTQVLLADFSATMKDVVSFDYDYPDPKVVKRRANLALHKLRSGLGAERGDRVIGIGVSAPYFIGGWDQELGFPGSVSTDWRSVDLKAGFWDAPDLPVFVENDASAAALAELVSGVGRTVRNFLHVSISTFVGAGLVLDGQLQTGPHGNTAAFGPFPVSPSKLRSVAKPKQEFEVLLHRASVYTLLNHLKSGGVNMARARELGGLTSKAGRRLLAEWQDDCADALAQAIIGAIAIVDIEAVVIDGVLPENILDDTIGFVEAAFARMLPAGLIAPKFCRGQFGQYGASLGASLLPLNYAFAPDAGVLMRNSVEKQRLVGSLT